jgi:ribosomal protein S18 acetylase RimI-like enzyme
MPDELRQAYEFLARADMAGSRTAPTRFGTAVSDDRVPKRYDSNYLLVDTLPAGTKADELAADMLEHERPLIFFRDEATADPLVPAFRELGWRIDRGVFMSQRHAPMREAPLDVVRELDADALREPRRRLAVNYSWATPEVLEQLHRAKLLIAERVDARFYGVADDGQVVAYADLYLEPPAAQIEDVGTLEEHRGRGYASALVLHAAAEARRAGAELVFLVADAEDWPQHLYRRLGFEPIGTYVKFIRPA